jgi:hypothetical protein
VIWLYVGPGGLDLALLNEAANVGALPEVGSGTAVADVHDRTRSASGILVQYERYRDGSQMGLVERWPDTTTRSYVGPLIKPDDLEFWPA